MVWWVLAFRLSGLGFYIAFCIVGGIILGVWLDNILDTQVVFLLLGLILGCAAAFYGTFRMVVPLFGNIDGGNQIVKGQIVEGQIVKGRKD